MCWLSYRVIFDTFNRKTGKQSHFCDAWLMCCYVSIDCSTLICQRDRNETKVKNVISHAVLIHILYKEVQPRWYIGNLHANITHSLSKDWNMIHATFKCYYLITDSFKKCANTVIQWVFNAIIIRSLMLSATELKHRAFTGSHVHV